MKLIIDSPSRPLRFWRRRGGGLWGSRAGGRWVFVELTEVYQFEADFEAKVEAQVNSMIEKLAAQPAGEG